jgi:hypothetical protein
LIAVFLLGVSSAAHSQGLTSLETDDLRLLYFDPGATYLSPYAARSFQNSLTRQVSVFGFDPDEKVTVLLKDFADYANAAAGSLPRNTLLIDVAPMSFAFETMPAGERLSTIMNHELVHITMMDQATQTDKRFRKFFGGKVSPISEHPETILYTYLTSPRVWTPGWYLEGSAVFMETWMAGGMGRAQGAYDEMVFRSMVRDNATFYDPIGLESEGSKIDFQVGVNNYLYGARFISYLAYTYSPETLISWISRKEGSKRHYIAHFEQVFGLPLEQAWQDWIEFEHEFQNRNLEAVRQFPITLYTDISDHPLGSVSRSYFDAKTRQIHLALRYPGVVAHLASISVDDGAMNKLVDVKGPMLYRVTSLAFDNDSSTLFYTADNKAYRDLMSINTRTGQHEMLIKDLRVGELVFNPNDRSIWGVRHLNGIVTLVQIPYPYAQWNQIHSFPYGQVLYDLDISSDGKLLSASFGDITGDQSLRVFNIDALLAGDVSPLNQFDFGQAVPEGFVFSPNDEYLYGSSYYTGISNIFRYELATDELEAVSNTESGFFRPVPLDDGSLLVHRFTGQGFVPTIIDPKPLEDVSAVNFFGAEIVRKYPQLEDWQVGSPADIPLDKMITHEGKYSSIRNISLESIYPIIEGYKDEISLGINTTFSDSLMLDTVDFSFSHSINSELPSSEDLHATLEWRHIVARATPLAGSWTVALRHNPADFYDLFGPTKRSLKGQSASISYEKTLVYDKPREMHLIVDLSHYTNLDRLPRYQNIDVTFDTLSTFGARLDYSRVRKSLGAVDDEKGFTWTLGATADHVGGDTIPKVLAEFDFGLALPWKHSSIWLRNSAGAAFGDPLDEFANFFFGGFGNNFVDHGEVKRYREHYAMPGFDLNAVPGRNFYRAMLEWNLPPMRFRNVGGSKFYLSWARTALFASNLITNLDNSQIRLDTQSYGIQIDLRFTVMSRLNMTLSTGYAKAFGNNSFNDDEWMVSLKIL